MPELAEDAQTTGAESPCQQYSFAGLLRWREGQKRYDLMLLYLPDGIVCVFSVLFFSCFYTPLSIAEFAGIARVISPGKAKLVLCARTAHQDGLVGNSGEFRYPERFFSGQSDKDGFFFGYFF